MDNSKTVTLIINGVDKSITAMKSAMGNLTELDTAAKKSNTSLGGIFDSVKSIAAVAGIGLTGAALFSFGKDAITASAQLSVLRSNFKGTTEDIELFRKATAETVTEADLIKLSNQATDLGISIKDQAILLSLAEDAADKYGGSVEENFQKVIKASEGATKGLKDLGIQKAVYDEIVKSYLQTYGVKTLDQLDAETQKWIQIESMIKATGVTLNDVANKLPDAADKIEGLGVKWEELKTKSGDVLLPILDTILGAIIGIDNWAIKTGNDLDKMIGLKGVFGNGDQDKLVDSTQERIDLMNALSHQTYVNEYGKLVSEEIKRTDVLNKQNNALKDQGDTLQKNNEYWLKMKTTIINDILLEGLDPQTVKLFEMAKELEDLQKKYSGIPNKQKEINDYFNLWIANVKDLDQIHIVKLIDRVEKLSRKFGIIPGQLELTVHLVDILASKVEMKPKWMDETNDKSGSKNFLGLPTELKPINIKSIDDAYQRIQEKSTEVTSNEILNWALMEGYAEEAFGNMASIANSFYMLLDEKQSVAFEAYKAFSIAETLAATYRSAVKAYEAMVVVPLIGPGLAVTAAAAAIAFGMSKVYAIQHLKPGASSGASGGYSAQANYSIPSAGANSISNQVTNNSSNTKNINITIHSVGGFGSSEDAYVRNKLAPAIKKAINDGVLDFGS